MLNIEVKKNVSMVSLSYALSDSAKALSALALLGKKSINIDMISLSPTGAGKVSLAFSFDDEDFSDLLAVLSEFRRDKYDLKISVRNDNAKILIVSEEMKNQSGVAEKILNSLTNAGIEVIMVTTAETEISVLVNSDDVDRAIEIIKA
ncbi:MAG: ACT domain-containing protein [Clostridia bacterium]|nr:ACT domain-containing protein [Clostridia bacterium]